MHFHSTHDDTESQKSNLPSASHPNKTGILMLNLGKPCFLVFHRTSKKIPKTHTHTQKRPPPKPPALIVQTLRQSTHKSKDVALAWRDFLRYTGCLVFHQYATCKIIAFMRFLPLCEFKRL